MNACWVNYKIMQIFPWTNHYALCFILVCISIRSCMQEFVEYLNKIFDLHCLLDCFSNKTCLCEEYLNINRKPEAIQQNIFWYDNFLWFKIVFVGNTYIVLHIYHNILIYALKQKSFMFDSICNAPLFCCINSSTELKFCVIMYAMLNKAYCI